MKVSLCVRERRALGGIEVTLSGTDPDLAALMAMFARLSLGEELPLPEQLPSRGSRLLAALPLVLARVLARMVGGSGRSPSERRVWPAGRRGRHSPALSGCGKPVGAAQRAPGTVRGARPSGRPRSAQGPWA